MEFVIGLVGEKGSGRGTFATLLEEISGIKGDRIRTSDVIAETLIAWDISAYA